jgi:hypothetical protein
MDLVELLQEIQAGAINLRQESVIAKSAVNRKPTLGI